MATVSETISEYEKIVQENAALKVQNAELISRLEIVGDKTVLSALTIKLETILADIGTLNQKKQDVQTKPLTEWEKSKLAQEYQRDIETLQAKRSELEKQKANLESQVIPV